MIRHPIPLRSLLLAALASCAAHPPAPGPRGLLGTNPAAPEEEALPPNNLRMMLGARSLQNDTYWGTLDGQGLLGLDYARVGEGKGFGFELGFSRSDVTKDTILAGVPASLRGSVAEVWGGMHYRSPIGESSFVMEGGLGPALVFAGQDVQVGSTSATARLDGSAPGVYAHAGVELYLNRLVSIGVDLHWLWTGELNLESGSLRASGGDADSITGTLVFGLHF